MAKLSYEQACERKDFIIRCLEVLFQQNKDNKNINDLQQFLTGEYKIADVIVKAELKPLLIKSNNKI